jgi:hypothetical protein
MTSIPRRRIGSNHSRRIGNVVNPTSDSHDPASSVRRDVGQHAISLYDAMCDASLLGKTFRAPSFWTWKTIAKLIDGIPLTAPREIDLVKECSGRTELPNTPVRRIVILAGRRDGKDRFMSAVAVWRVTCRDWSRVSSEGEQMAVVLVGADKRQAGILRRYCEGLLRVPLLAREVSRRTDEVIEFRNGASLEIVTNDARLIRGRSAIAVLGSEASYWKVDEHSASSDEEVVAAALPSMSMCPDGGLLILGSSVYRRRGYVYKQFKAWHGNNEVDDLCWLCPSSTMNPALPSAVVESALAEDSQRYGAEYLSRWREDLSDFCPVEVLERCTDQHISERPPQHGVSYLAHADSAGGTGQDSFALAVAHCEYADGGNHKVILDLLRERKPPFIPRDVVAEYAALLKCYGISEVRGDGFGGGFHASEWARHGITFVPAEHTTSELYLFALPMLLSGRARLLDLPRLRHQFSILERRPQPSGREQVTHPNVASAHDDLACATAGALVAAADGEGYVGNWSLWLGGDSRDDEAAKRAFQRGRFTAYLRACGMPWGL